MGQGKQAELGAVAGWVWVGSVLSSEHRRDLAHKHFIHSPSAFLHTFSSFGLFISSQGFVQRQQQYQNKDPRKLSVTV